MTRQLPSIQSPQDAAGPRRRIARALLAGAAATALPAFPLMPAFAQAGDYPNRTIRIIVPFSPGGSTDLIARVLAEQMSASLKQAVVVENRAGAAGSIGAEAVAKAQPDGYTLLMATTGVMSINNYLYRTLGYNAERDLEPVSYTTLSPNVLVVSNTSDIKDVKTIIERARARTGALSFASSGAGSSTHLSGELFKAMIGAEILHVPYKGSSQAIIDVVSGEVTMLFDNAASALPFVQRNQLKPLAVTGLKRMAALPGVPTVAEAGVAGYESLSWTGIAAPRGTPAAVVTLLNQTIDRILALPEVRRKFDEMGVEAVGGPPERFAAHVRTESAKWGKLIQEAGIRIQ